MVRLLHVGLGPLGRRILKDFHETARGEILAAVDVNPELAGRSLAELEPGLPDVPVHASFEAFADWERVGCVLVTTSSDLEVCAETFRWLLDRGHTVVSSCEELLYPWLRHPVLAQELHQRAVRHGGRLLGTGINPGFLMDTLPVVVTGLCTRVESLEIHRIQDAAPRRLPFQRKIGATLDLEAFRAREAEGTLRHVGLLESLHFVAHYLGWKLERWTETLEPIVAERALECGLGPIAPGQAAGVRQVGEGFVGERCVLRLVFQAAIDQADPHDRVVVHGEPPLDVVFRGGVHGDVATSAVLLNSIASLRRAEPGLHTMATIRPTPCRPRFE